MQPVGRRPHPVAPRQVERQNLRRIPRAQLEQAEEHGVPLQVQQPNDNDPQPAYRLLLLRTPNLPISLLLLRTITMKLLLHHIYHPAPQVVQPVPQIENGEALIIPAKSDIDVFASQKMCNQIWNLEYIDLAHLHYKNCVSNIDKPKEVLGFDEDGDTLVERSKYSKVKYITNIEE
jgi:hypothetical protein